jgi:hypothetical protein
MIEQEEYLTESQITRLAMELAQHFEGVAISQVSVILHETERIILCAHRVDLTTAFARATLHEFEQFAAVEEARHALLREDSHSC